MPLSALNSLYKPDIYVSSEDAVELNVVDVHQSVEFAKTQGFEIELSASRESKTATEFAIDGLLLSRLQEYFKGKSLYY
tara:strand:+ start:6396 stop:6632 length:237 start_codon:yes stop_codon:yes gene_type:complete